MLGPTHGGPLRVAYVTQWFTPEPAGPAAWIAGALDDEGFALHTVTAIPNYPAGIVYPGYRPWRVTRESIGNIRLLRCPVYPSHDQSAGRRALNYLSFALTASWVGRRILNSADVALIYSSPATAALPAMVAHRRSGVPYVLLIQDLWPDTVLQTEMVESGSVRRLAARLLGAFDRHSTDHASHILVISPGMKQALVSRGVQADKITVMFNWIDESVLYARPRSGALRKRLAISDDDLVFMYAGNHGSAQGLHAWISAIERTRDLTNLHFVFVGSGTEKARLVERATELQLERTHFVDAVGVDDFAELAADADAQIISLKDAPLFRITIPGKVQSCLALQSAVIAAVAGDAATVLSEAGAGILAAPEDPASIERAIRQAQTEGRSGLRDMGAAGYQYYRDSMSRDRGSAILAAVLRRAATSGRDKTS